MDGLCHRDNKKYFRRKYTIIIKLRRLKPILKFCLLPLWKLLGNHKKIGSIDSAYF